MKKIYYLPTCSTCKRLMNRWPLRDAIILRDIRNDRITEEEIDEMKRLAGSYEALFSRRAMKFREMGLHERNLSETDYRRLILEEETFLKRPVVIAGEAIFIGTKDAGHAEDALAK